MKFRRGLLLGLITGVAAGIFVLIRQQLKREMEFAADSPVNIEIEHQEAAPTDLPPDAIPTEVSTEAAVKDRLEKIRGIGPVYARRLNQAGVFTFADLAAQSPEQILAIIGRTRLPVDPQAWIHEAQELVNGV